MKNKEFEEYRERNVFMEKEDMKKILDGRCFHSLSVGNVFMTKRCVHMSFTI